MNQFKDNAEMPIMAFDFDGTLNRSNIYPDIGEPRPFAKRVVNLLYDIGVKVIIWTCRDICPHMGWDDIEPIEIWLKDNGFKYHDINKSFEYSPFHYESRKIYANMYVDDKAFGWKDTDTVMLEVLESFLLDVVGVNKWLVDRTIKQISMGKEVCEIDKLKDSVHRWRV